MPAKRKPLPKFKLSKADAAAAKAQIAVCDAAKRNESITVRCWTKEHNSSLHTHAKSLTAAVRFIRQNGPLYRNWSLVLTSET